jgi:hypothetical protein
MDGKSLIFIVAFLVAGVLAVLGVYAMVFENATIASPKVYMDFIFAGILAIMAVLQFKVLEANEKA